MSFSSYAVNWYILLQLASYPHAMLVFESDDGSEGIYSFRSGTTFLMLRSTALYDASQPTSFNVPRCNHATIPCKSFPSTTSPSTALSTRFHSMRYTKLGKDRDNLQSSPLQRRLNLLNTFLDTRLDSLGLSRNMWCHGRETTTPSWTPNCGLRC